MKPYSRHFAVRVIALLALWIAADNAQAQILFTAGDMVEITTPVSFEPESFESSSTIAILDEGSSVLPGDIFVNAFGPGIHDGSAPPYLLIPEGTRVRSYHVHFDPDGGVVSLTGSVFFEPGETILGVQTHTPLLYDTDPFLGHPDATYPAGFIEFRAFESLPGTDTVELPFDMTFATFSLIAELGVDHARIITIPEPSSIALLISAATLLGIRRRPVK